MLCMMLMAGWVLHIPFSFNYTLLICCVIASAAAGNIWNDLNDQKADLINKPQKIWIGLHIPKIHALTAYWVLVVWAILFSLILFFQGFSFVLVITMIAQISLFLYSIIFKRMAIAGNLIISILAWMSFLLLILYAKDAGEINKRWVIHMGLLAFFTTWIREAVKDMQDITGDREAGYRTWAVIKPLSYSKTYILLLATAYVSYVAYYILGNSWLIDFPERLIPYLIVLMIPVAWIIMKLLTAEIPEDFKRIATGIKIWMVAGILSTLLWKGIVF